jgi:hypothetical protein
MKNSRFVIYLFLLRQTAVLNINAIIDILIKVADQTPLAK